MLKTAVLGLSSRQEGHVVMQDEMSVFEDFLRKQRLKHSKPRRDIVDVFLASDGHLTAHELYHEVKERNASIGFATVYRTLRLLAQMEEFSRSRYRLEGRYEHVLVDAYRAADLFAIPTLADVLTQTAQESIACGTPCLSFDRGGVTEVVVCDQLKSGVTVPCRYEPGLQRTYEEFAQHHNTVILPARPKSPRDKPKVEVGVQVAQRWVLARLRHERFFSLAALNARITELLAQLNAKMMRLYRASRRELFVQLDQPVLRPLPAEPFVFGEWTINARVNIDYHIDVHGHYYSVPHALLHELVDARRTATTVEIFHRGQRVAAHVRNDLRGRHTTDPAHMPKAHREHLEWSPSRLIAWARTIGPHTAALAEAILADRPHPEQGYRSCLGLLRLGRRHGEARLEAACARAGTVGARSYRHVESILKHGLDRLPILEPAVPQLPLAPVHEHVRGRDYYQ